MPRGAPMSLAFAGVPGRVVLRDAPEVLAGLLATLRGWEPDILGPQAGSPPICAVQRVGRRFHLASRHLDKPLVGLPAASAVCGVIADLAQGFYEHRPGSLALHCGAFTISDRLVLLAGEARAGKSTLIARLSAEPDLRIFCDDVLPVLDGAAFGLGVAPRLRLPLPRGASAGFRAHVAAHVSLTDDRYAYLCSPNIAVHGSRAVPRVLLVLARSAGAAARLHHLAPAEAVQHLMDRNMADSGAETSSFEAVLSLAAGMKCLKLVYSDLEQAVALIRRAFGGAECPDPAVPVAAALAQGAAAPPPRPVDLSLCWQRSATVGVRRLDGDLFLWDAQTQGRFRLNQMAGAVWSLLEEDGRGDDISALLQEAFPEEDPRRIATDVALLLGALAEVQLILPATAGARHSGPVT